MASESTYVRTRDDISSLPLRRYGDAVTPVMVRRISWGAVLAGVAVGMITQLWLSMLGVAIGASTIDPLKEANPLSGIGVGSAIWLGISLLISSFIGGWVAGRLAGIPRRLESALHGAVSWACATIASFLLIGTVFGSVVMGAGKLAGGAANVAGQAAANNPTLQQNAGGIVDQARRGADNLINRGQNAVQSGQAQQQAREVGDKAAKAVSGSSWALVAAMLLGLLAGVGGAAVATPSNPLASTRRT
jgi:hypothetical protein